MGAVPRKKHYGVLMKHRSLRLCALLLLACGLAAAQNQTSTNPDDLGRKIVIERAVPDGPLLPGRERRGGLGR